MKQSNNDMTVGLVECGHFAGMARKPFNLSSSSFFFFFRAGGVLGSGAGWNSSLISCGKFGSPYMGKTASAGAGLPFPLFGRAQVLRRPPSSMLKKYTAPYLALQPLPQ